MKKQLVLAMAVAVSLVGSIALPAQAAGRYSLNTGSQTKSRVVIGGRVNSLPELKSVLEDWCDRVQSGNWKDCPVITLPDCNQPDEELPDTETPDVEEPDENIPDAELPDQEENDETVPDTEEPDVDAPDTNRPEEDGSESESDTESLSFAKQVVNLVNEERAKAGLNALIFDESIAAAALVRAKEIETSFSHTRPDGRGFSTVLTDNGISFYGAGENIAWGQTTPEQVMNAWMNSEGHRANILNAKFTRIGVGNYQNANGRNYWTQLFTY